jgi:hypothetical protein
MSFRTDRPELYRGKRVTTCPACGAYAVEVLGVQDDQVRLSHHERPSDEEVTARG